jgi:general secretion pathway protein G
MVRNTATGTDLRRVTMRGFTMIELLIVMTLVVILASIGMVQYRNSVTRAEEAALKENLFRLRDAMDQFYADKNKWPADLAELVSEGYIREVPKDPMTKSADTWQTEAADADRPIRHRRAASTTFTADPIERDSTERATRTGSNGECLALALRDVATRHVNRTSTVYHGASSSNGPPFCCCVDRRRPCGTAAGVVRASAAHRAD